jgi:hypothetical protein
MNNIKQTVRLGGSKGPNSKMLQTFDGLRVQTLHKRAGTDGDADHDDDKNNQ